MIMKTACRAPRPTAEASPLDRERIFRKVESRVRELAGVDRGSPVASRLCSYYAFCGLTCLLEEGYDCQLQAGTAMFYFSPPERPGSTHYSYVWSPDSPLSKAAQFLGGMPEMHIWLAGVDRQSGRHEIIDFTASHQKENCEDAFGKGVWLMPEPPPFFWGVPDELPDKWIYDPNLDATRLAYKLFMRFRELG